MKTEYDRLKENLNNQVELLSYLLNDDSLYFKCIDIIRADMFTGENRRIYDSFLSVIKDNTHPDVLTISELSGIPVEDVLKVFTYYSGSPIPVDVLLHELFDFMAKDKLVKLAGFISSQVSCGTDYELIIDQMNKVSNDLQLGSTTSIINMEQAVTTLMNTIVKNATNTIDISGTPTGLKVIDTHMGGFHAGDLVVLAGETSHGKTSFALTCMYGTSVLHGMPTGIISHEMTPEQLTGRLSAYASHISSKHLLYGKLSDAEMHQFNNRINKLISSKIYIQDFIRRELIDTIASIRMMVIQHGVKYVVVENAGNINVKGKNGDEERTAEISKSMKSIAMELGITVILISHLARERDGRKVQPSINRLKHSGQLESDADVVMFVYRAELHGHEYFNDSTDQDGISATGMAKVFYGKGRNVGMAQTYMKFDEYLTMFSDESGTGTPF